jgi:trimethylamine:corrinoid methyltransferase-like protein
MIIRRGERRQLHEAGPQVAFGTVSMAKEVCDMKDGYRASMQRGQFNVRAACFWDIVTLLRRVHALSYMTP